MSSVDTMVSGSGASSTEVGVSASVPQPAGQPRGGKPGDAVLRCSAPFHAPPQDFGPDLRATYGRDLDGNVFELVENTRPEPGPG